MKLSDDAKRMLETIARNAGDNVAQGEMLEALIYQAYNLPHSEWERLINNWKEKIAGESGNDAG